jgi:hypothetical protein
MIHTVLKNDSPRVENLSDPSTYYTLVDIIKSVSDEEKERLETIIISIARERESVSKLAKDLVAVANQFHEEAIHSRKRNTGIMGQMDAGEDEEDTYRFQDHNYIILMASVMNNLASAYGMFYDFATDLRVPKILTVKERVNDEPDTFEAFNGIFQEMQFNGHAVKGYANSLATLFNSFDAPGGIASQLYKQLEPFYKYLLHTHQKEGVKIITNPVVTNVAMHIFENIDSHGEIKKDGESSQVSAYTLRKAETLAQALVNPTVQEFMKDSDKLQYLIRVAITDISKIVVDLNDIFASHESKLRSVTSSLRPDWMGKDALPQQVLSQIDSIKFSNIVYNEPIEKTTGKLAAKMRDETIEKIAGMITQKDIDFTDIVEYVMQRKAELNKFFFEENSFYVCKISEGNPFLGLAPGALQVEPAEKPRGKLKDILGSGFQEIKDFAGSIEESSKFHDLFVATSPSKSADKSNVLMVGPMGCGKTEVLRAIGADKGSIGIFAQGSDFLTCWKGEAEKNPKRLFQEGLKLAQESGRHVHFLIDEIESLLNNDRDISGNNNLTLEFQILMDGVVAYPNLSVWGATNHVERIPMPMIRRFNKVLVVGELSRSDRADLLKMFTNYMPITAKVQDRDWENWAVKLEGATGDVIRKIADHIWREKLTSFVKDKPKKAEEMVELLNANGKFNIDEFTKDERTAFKAELAKYMIVTAADMDASIDFNLKNLGIRSEIETATATYKASREYLEGAEKGLVEDKTCAV